MQMLQKDFILFSGYGREWKISFCNWLESYKAKQVQKQLSSFLKRKK